MNTSSDPFNINVNTTEIQAGKWPEMTADQLSDQLSILYRRLASAPREMQPFISQGVDYLTQLITDKHNQNVRPR